MNVIFCIKQLVFLKKPGGTRLRTIFEKRVERLRKKMVEKQLDTLMIHIEENRRYLSGFTGEDGGYNETSGVLFITRDALVLATDSRYELQAQAEAPLYSIYIYKKGLVEEIPVILKKLKTERLGFEGDRISHSDYMRIQENISTAGLIVTMNTTSEVVEKFRAVKNDQEITCTKNALAIAENAFLAVTANLRPGITERQLAWELEKTMRTSGADSLSFPTIVASGPNSALPHAVPGDRTIRENEPLLFDWGARVNGYCSDTTRTLFLGEPDPLFKKVYRTVLDANLKATEAIKTGVSSKAVYQIALDHIDNAGFKGKFTHGLGHGTGLAIHEAPRLSSMKETILEEGMLVTVEPGIYLAGVGGVRLENQVVVGNEGPDVLNHLSFLDL
jgi:Xaa-Pro aminopeptidase